jgi:hypothetical protein
VDAEPAPAPDLEEPLRNLVHLCEGVRVLCACGEQRGLTLTDAEPLAVLAALLAADLRRQVLGRQGLRDSAPG